MPKATASQDTERRDLKSCPEGFILARRLTYGEKLARREMVSKFKVGAGRNGDNDEFSGEMQLVHEAATLYDFQHCIIDHNLTDENDNPLNLGSPHHIRLLDPRIGEEIATFLDSLNNFEEDEGE
jgi:hypothetical protein